MRRTNLDHLLLIGLGFEGTLGISPQNALRRACTLHGLHNRKGCDLVSAAERRPLSSLLKDGLVGSRLHSKACIVAIEQWGAVSWHIAAPLVFPELRLKNERLGLE